MLRTLTSSDFCEYRLVRNVYDKVSPASHKLQYRFKTNKTKSVYIVWVEFYPNDFIAVKFHLKAHSHFKYRYNVLTNFHEGQEVIHTTLKITLDHIKVNPNLSVGFVGANTVKITREFCPVEKKYIKKAIFDSKECTKRFRVYRVMAYTFVSEKDWMHIDDVDHSLFMLIRRDRLLKEPDVKDKMGDFLNEHYKEIFELHQGE